MTNLMVLATVVITNICQMYDKEANEKMAVNGLIYGIATSNAVCCVQTDTDMGYVSNGKTNYLFTVRKLDQSSHWEKGALSKFKAHENMIYIKEDKQ